MPNKRTTNRDLVMRFRNVCPAAGTFSKDARSFWGQDVDFVPSFLESGYGATVRDNENNSYIDWICGLGAMLLGYGYETFDQHVYSQIIKGSSFSMPTMLEMEVAETLTTALGLRVPGWTPDSLQVRFTKTGSECTEAAVRLARAVTGRDLLLRCSDSYLGWGDTFIATTPPALGVPESYKRDTHLFKYGQDVKTLLDGQYNEPACVILEQGLTNPPERWYKELRKWCDDNGCLLILDETASGFRYGLGGAAQRFGIEPDLATYGKALGNGFPISALVGRREYMEWFGRESPIFVSGTFCGETASLAAAQYVLNTLMDNEKIHYEHLSRIGMKLYSGLLDAFTNTPYKIIGHDVRSVIVWPSDQHHAWFTRNMAKMGILMNRPNYTTLSHTEEQVAQTVSAAKYVVREAEKGVETIKDYQLPRVLFRNR